MFELSQCYFIVSSQWLKYLLINAVEYLSKDFSSKQCFRNINITSFSVGCVAREEGFQLKYLNFLGDLNDNITFLHPMLPVVTSEIKLKSMRLKVHAPTFWKHLISVVLNGMSSEKATYFTRFSYHADINTSRSS